jgi:putative ABC transport system permease protein
MRFVRIRRLALAALLAVGAATAGEVEPDASPILLSRQLAEAKGIEVGDVVHVGLDRSGTGARPFEVVAVYEPVPDPFRLTVERLEARLHLSDLVDWVADPDDPFAAEAVTRVNIALVDPADRDRFARDLRAKVPGLLVLPAAGDGDGSDPFVVLERFHVAIAAVTVIGGAAFLLALMVIRVEERRETAGILRLLGLSRPRILLGIFVEGAFVAGAGALIGLACAALAQGAFNRFFQWYYDTALVFVRITPGIALKCVAIAVPLGTLAGLAASWTILRRTIMALLRR